MCLLYASVASTWFEDALEAGEAHGRVGFWERLWFGASCIAIFKFFETLW